MAWAAAPVLALVVAEAADTRAVPPALAWTLSGLLAAAAVAVPPSASNRRPPPRSPPPAS